jgi:hypothetical protein
MRKPAAALPFPPTPAGLSQPFVIGRLPGWWRSTTTRPAIASPIRTRYSIRAMPTWVRAVKRMPTTAIASMTRLAALPMAIAATVSGEVEPKTASNDGPSKRISATVPMI